MTILKKKTCLEPNRLSIFFGHFLSNGMSIIGMLHLTVTQPMTIQTLGFVLLLFLFWSYFQLIPALDVTSDKKVDHHQPLKHFLDAFFICIPTAKNEFLSLYRLFTRKKSFN